MTMPGECKVIQGVEVVAISDDEFEGFAACGGCHFLSSDAGCTIRSHDCKKVIWLTPLDYITHRLTKGTSP